VEEEAGLFHFLKTPIGWVKPWFPKLGRTIGAGLRFHSPFIPVHSLGRIQDWVGHSKHWGTHNLGLTIREEAFNLEARELLKGLFITLCQVGPLGRFFQQRLIPHFQLLGPGRGFPLTLVWGLKRGRGIFLNGFLPFKGEPPLGRRPNPRIFRSKGFLLTLKGGTEKSGTPPIGKRFPRL